MKSTSFSFFLLLFCARCLLQAAPLCQFKDADIIIPEPTPGIVRLAAEELQKHLQQLTGGEFPIGKGGNHEFSLALGNAPQNQALNLDLDSLPRDGFFILTTEKRIHILGRDDPSTGKASLFHTMYDCQNRATLLGVYEFLEQQGIRWPAPGEINTCFPEKKIVTSPIGLQRHQPVFTDRMGSAYWNFMQAFPDSAEYVKSSDEVYLWCLRLKLSGRTSAIGCHSEQYLKLWEIWKDYPERFQLMKDGKRNFNYLCWTDPAVEEVWYRSADAFFSGHKPETAGLPHLNSWIGQNSPREFFIDPMDHGSHNDGRCLCPRCEEFRLRHPSPDDTEMLWKVIASVAERIRDKHPGKLIATLVYPPKHHLPTTVKLPDNIAVRICLPGAKNAALPQRLQGELQRIKEWSDILGKDQVPLWTYQCEVFGRKLPGPPEVYPGLFASYLQHIRPLAAGMFNETHSLSHTYRNLDMYIQARLLWDPDRDLNRELKEYFDAYYGTEAGPVLQALFQRFEDNWIRYWRRVTPDTTDLEKVGLAPDGKLLQKIVWREFYTTAEMQHIDDTLKQAEALSAGNKEYLRRVLLLRKWMFNIMKEERSEVMDKEERRSKIRLELQNIPIPEGSFPSESAWDGAVAQPLRAASRLLPQLQAGGSFKVLRSGEKLFVKADFEEPLLSGSKTQKGRQNGDVDIWQDNDTELFIYAPESNTFWQFVINDEGKWAANCLENRPGQWKAYPGVEISCRAIPGGWQMQAAIPLAGFGTGEWRFNLTRNRMVEGAAQEYSTWSELAMLGNWHEPDNYGIIIFKD